MEPKQINEAQNEYEAGLEDSQPVKAMSDYELFDKVDILDWIRDYGDAITGNHGGALTILTFIRCALISGNNPEVRRLHCQDIGEIIVKNAVDYAHRCIAAEETGGVR